MSNHDEDEENERQNDRARKIWSQIRRMSSVGSGGESDGYERTVSSGSVRVSNASVGNGLNDETEQRRAMFRDRALMNRHSVVGGETMHSFLPPVVDRKENRPALGNGMGEKGYEKEMGVRAGAVSNSLSSRNRKEEENTRWGWSAWWQ